MADFSHVVYSSVKGSSLFTYSSIISMCTLETVYLKNLPQYTELCETKVVLFDTNCHNKTFYDFSNFLDKIILEVKFILHMNGYIHILYSTEHLQYQILRWYQICLGLKKRDWNFAPSSRSWKNRKKNYLCIVKTKSLWWGPQTVSRWPFWRHIKVNPLT